ncbi:MAG: hypothetical protein J2P13_03340 [Acidobacteria bacterium]|nr:hypothetical protein [Acidobacteriota bacterium]
MSLPLIRQSIRAFAACLLATIFVVPQNLAAQVHVVSPSELEKQALDKTHERQKNLEIVNRFFSSPTAEKAMSIVHTDPNQVKIGISRLSDQELARLAERAQKAQTDFAAGNVSDRDLLIIIVAALVLVVIILAATH